MTEDLKAAAASWARVVVAALVGWAGTKMVDGSLDVTVLTADDGKAALAAVVGATVLTVTNWVRRGDSRFGNR